MIDRISSSDDHPMVCLSWYDAALFCNWLSHVNGLDSCYLPTGGTRFDPADQSVPPARYKELKPVDANGYRLPTDAEWEYACRAGTKTIYFFGDDADLLDDYAVFQMQDHKTEKCGTKLPNAWGIFNMLGNAGELCQDWYRDVAVVDSDVGVDLDFRRAGRGGMPGASPPFVAVWTRMPWGRLDVHREIESWGGASGFRVARTISP